MTHNKTWTTAEHQFIIDKWREKPSNLSSARFDKRVAKELGRTHLAVNVVRSKLGLVGQRYTRIAATEVKPHAATTVHATLTDGLAYIADMPASERDKLLQVLNIVYGGK